MTFESLELRHVVLAGCADIKLKAHQAFVHVCNQYRLSTKAFRESRSQPEVTSRQVTIENSIMHSDAMHEVDFDDFCSCEVCILLFQIINNVLKDDGRLQDFSEQFFSG